MSEEFDWDGLRAAFASQRAQIEAIREALTRPDVAALLCGEAVAVPRVPTEEMVAAAAKATFCSDGWSSFFDLHDAEYLANDGYRAMLAASPFAEKEGKE